MGIQDRDYYWEKHNKASQSEKTDLEYLLKNKQYSSKSLSTSRKRRTIFYLISPALILLGLWYGANELLKYRAPKIKIKETQTIKPISGGVVLKRDRQGHFRGTALINNEPMPFLIDTGATKTVIPKHMAIKVGLPFGRTVQTNTAGGKVKDYATRIHTLKIGNMVISNLDAHINSHLNEVLIGMNTLKHFRMTQDGDTLILSANSKTKDLPINTGSIHLESLMNQQSIKRPSKIKRRVVCDEQNQCTTTIYSER